MLNLSLQELRDLPLAIYSGIRARAEKKPLTDLAKAIHEASISVLEKFGHIARSPNEFAVPLGALLSARALAAGTYSASGAFVGTELGEIEPALRASSVCARAGARIMSGLSKNLAIPLEKTVNTFSWLPELVTTNTTATDLTAGQLNLSPNRLAGASSMSVQADMQTGGRLAEFLLESLARGIGKAIDAAALVGSGVAGEPTGVFHKSGVGSVTWGGVASWAKIAGASGFENTLLDANIEPEAISFIAHPNIKAKHRTIAKFSSDAGSGALWEVDEDVVAGHQAFTSTSVSSTLGYIGGDFSKLVIALFGGNESAVRLIVDPYSYGLSDKISFVCEALADCGVTRAEAFVIAADSAVQ